MNIQMPKWLEQTVCLLETLNEGVVIADDADRILFVNSAFEEMTGIARGDMLGRETGNLYHDPADFAVAQEIRAKILQKGRDREEFFLTTKAGGRLPVVLSARAAAGPTDAPLRSSH
jgi:PAS domain S-box-containing protein